MLGWLSFDFKPKQTLELLYNLEINQMFA